MSTVPNKTWFCIQNDGEIDMNALRLLGATTKDSTKIGYFGSGIKFSLASAFRLGIKLRIFQGEKEIKLTLKKTTLRETPVEVICIGGKDSGITTGLGRDWKAWYILREFYCNSLDETGSKTCLTLPGQDPCGQAGFTRIYIEMGEVMQKILENRDKYFSAERISINEWFAQLKAKIYRPLVTELNESNTQKLIVYRRGIQVCERDVKAIYDYDFVGLPINEARETDSWSIDNEILKLWKKYCTEDMISDLINTSNKYEHKLTWDRFSDTNMSDAWLSLKDRIIIPTEQAGYFGDDINKLHCLLPHSLCIELHRAFGHQLQIRGVSTGSTEICELRTNDTQHQILQEVIHFSRKCRAFERIEQFPIKIASLGIDVLGQADLDNNIIYLSPEVFLKGKRAVLETLIEEYVHLNNHVHDRSRGMQNALISIIVSCIEDKEKMYV